MSSDNSEEVEDTFNVQWRSTVNVWFNWNGRWQFGKKIGYVDGKTELLKKFDPDLISYQDIWNDFTQRLGVKDLKYMACLEPGKEMSEGLFAFVGDASVHRLLSSLNYFVRDIVFFPITKYDMIEFPDAMLDKLGISRKMIDVDRNNVDDAGPSAVGIDVDGPDGGGVYVDKHNEVGTEGNIGLASQAEDNFRSTSGLGSVGLSPEYVSEDYVQSEDRNQAGNANETEDTEGGVEQEESEPDVGDSEEDSELEEEDSDGQGESDSDLGEFLNEKDINIEIARKRVRYDPKEGAAYFTIGMTFKDADSVREALKNYSVTTGKDYKIVRSEPGRVRVRCRRENCPFLFYASKEKGKHGLKIKTLCMQHKCYRVFKNTKVTSKWIASQFREFIQDNPDTRTRRMQTDLEKQFRVHVSRYKCKRARRRILNELEGNYKEDFALLNAFAHELRNTNPGSTVAIELCRDGLKEGKSVFKRMFIYFDACKTGWKAGCRPIIGLDGCFLKTKIKGMLLSAIGVDGMNHMYPIAFAVVSKENNSNWSWFLRRMVHDLELGDGAQLTLMSDMQKGLIPAVLNILPRAEHRWCARHIYANWSKKWRGEEMRKRFWVCAWSTYQEEFNDNLQRLGELSKKAVEDVVSYAPQAWCRAFFSNRCKSAMVDNNISETFNSWILSARFKTIVRMIDEIRVKIMNLLVDNEKCLDNWINDYSPQCMEMFEDWADIASSCKVEWNGETAYEVSEGHDRHSVWLDKNMCSCRAWDLTGIPCPHAIAAFYHKGEDPVLHISHYYHKDTYAAAYSKKMQPVKGRQFWRVEGSKSIDPPPIPKMPGRPKKMRKKDKSEQKKMKSTSDAQETGIERHSIKGKQQTCGRCGQLGHNRRSCKKDIVQPNLQDEALSEDGLNGATTTEIPTMPPHLEPTDNPTPNDNAPTAVADELLNHVQVDVNKPSNAILRHRIRKSTQISNNSRQEKGHGILYDENGKIIYNPGHVDSYVVCSYGDGQDSSEDDEPEPMMPDHEADPQKKFPIPSEKDVRTNARKVTHSATASRIITVRGNGYDVSLPIRLPFQPSTKKRSSLRDLEKQKNMKKLRKAAN